jgi:hypothetical protein
MATFAKFQAVYGGCSSDSQSRQLPVPRPPL